MSIATVLFDVDGTLIDTVYAHVDAWDRAFHSRDISIPEWEIHRQIGKDGSLLVRDLLTRHDIEVDDELIAVLSAVHATAFATTTDRMSVLPGARDLVQACSDRGATVVLASSSPADELDAARAALDIDAWVDAVTTSADVETAKPDTGIVKVALDRVGADASTAVMFGDAVWDSIAATAAGVRSIGLLSGGISRDELLSAGAKMVFTDPADVVDSLDDLWESL